MKKLSGKWVGAAVAIGVLIAVYFVFGKPTNKSATVNDARHVQNNQQPPRNVETPVVPPKTYSREIIVKDQWVGVDLPVGWSMDDSWGNAPLDIRINKDPQRVIEWPKTEGPHDYGIVWYKEYRLHRTVTGEAKVTCTFTELRKR